MRIAEMLHAIASWLESPHNEALLLAEQDDDCMKVVADSCVLAAALLKNAADEVDQMEPAEESMITSESIESIANLAAALDSSGDPELQKQASVLDELLLGIAAPTGAFKMAKMEEDNRTEELKKKYHSTKEKLDKMNKVSDIEKDITKSEMTKDKYRPLEAPMSTRHCPDHPGTSFSRVGENMYQCEMDKKVYNFETGFTLNDGTKVPGTSVANQSDRDVMPSYSIYDTRDGRLATNR